MLKRLREANELQAGGLESQYKNNYNEITEILQETRDFFEQYLMDRGTKETGLFEAIGSFIFSGPHVPRMEVVVELPEEQGTIRIVSGTDCGDKKPTSFLETRDIHVESYPFGSYFRKAKPEETITLPPWSEIRRTVYSAKDPFDKVRNEKRKATASKIKDDLIDVVGELSKQSIKSNQ
jgi:hypothetical protein